MHTHKEITSISAESYAQQTYCQMHCISYCTTNIHQMWKQWRPLTNYKIIHILTSYKQSSIPS